MADRRVGESRFVVYLAKMGNTPVGIYQRRVVISDRLAFVLPREDGSRADILPKSNVFETERAAQEYLAGTGLKRWVVDRGSSYGTAHPATLFQAYVQFYTDERFSGRRSGHNKAIKRVDGVALDEVRTYSFAVFDTKKEALAVFRHRRDEQKKDALKTKQQAEAMLKALVATTRSTR